ncbi:hypothetical protein N9W62_08455 [Akkermansiaceae bacterium]|nr:hypothetical protein [Akkermansiaceae bacterium]
MTIKKISNKEIKIIHASGIATIPVSDLTAELIKDLGIKETPVEPTKKDSGIIKKDEALTPDKYGVRKWPTFLGKSIKWGMSQKEATKVMRDKGFKYTELVRESDEIYKKIWDHILVFKGRFSGYENVTIALNFSRDDKLLKQQIILSSMMDAYIKKRKEHYLPYGKAVVAAVKMRDAIVKQYGKPTEEQFIVGEVFNGTQKSYDGGGRVLTRAEAIRYASKTRAGETLHYNVAYKPEVTKAYPLKTPYIGIYSNNMSTFRIDTHGPELWEIMKTKK